MKIQYKNRSLYLNLTFGLLWLLFYLLQANYVEDIQWYNKFWLVLSLAYSCIFLYQLKYKYIRIENGVLTVNGPLGKSIALDKINRIKYFAGDYIIKSDDKNITIYTQNIDSESQDTLKTALEKINAEWV